MTMRKHASVQRDELSGLEDVFGGELPGWVRERLRKKREKNGALIPVDYWENMTCSLVWEYKSGFRHKRAHEKVDRQEDVYMNNICVHQYVTRSFLHTCTCTGQFTF